MGNKSSSHDSNSKTINQQKSTFKQRIDALLKIVDNNYHSNKQDIYDIVSKFYTNYNGINGFIKDYGKYIEIVTAENIYKKQVCDIASCKNVTREYRDRSKYGIDESQRFKLYSQCKSERAIVIRQLLDQLHIVKHHLVDLGLRYKHKNDTNDTMNDEYSDNKILQQIKRDLVKVRKNTLNAVNCRDIDAGNSNKFITTILNEEKKGNEESQSENKAYSPYSFGIRFYYHDYYRNNKNKRELLPGTETLETGNYSINNAYSYASWFVPAKFKSVKDEVLAGNHPLPKIEYDNTLLKAEMKYKALSTNIKGADGMWAVVYGIAKDSKIRLKHILSVLLYTNHTELSTHFSRSFRKLNIEESDKSLIQRHSQYANWARSLREVIECWGSESDGSKNKVQQFHHGISSKMVFAGLNQRFCLPTSTSLLYEVAVMFAFGTQSSQPGIVISMKSNGTTSKFFNCMSWSDFSGEAEMLFIGGFGKLEFCGLSDLTFEVNYNYYIRSMTLFQKAVIDGTVSTERVENVNVTLITKLIDDALNDHKKDLILQKDLIPSYIQCLFSNLIQQTKRISLDIGLFDYEMFNPSRYGYKRMKHLFFDKKNQINWRVLTGLFSGMESVCIRRRQNGFNSSNGSLLIDDSLLSNMLSTVKNTKNESKIEKVVIKNPLNTSVSLEKMKNKYSKYFHEIKYELSIKNTTHPEYGSNSIFSITRLSNC